MIFLKKMKEGIRTAIGIGLHAKKQLKNFKKRIRLEIAENKIDLQEKLKVIQDNIELLSNEIRNPSFKEKVKKETKRIAELKHFPNGSTQIRIIPKVARKTAKSR